MNFSGIITPNCNVKDLPFRQKAASETSEQNHTASLLLQLSHLSITMGFFQNKYRITKGMPFFFNLFISIKCLELHFKIACKYKQWLSYQEPWPTLTETQHSLAIYLFICSLRCNFTETEMFICTVQIHHEVAKIGPKMLSHRPLNWKDDRVNKHNSKQQQNGQTFFPPFTESASQRFKNTRLIKSENCLA